MVSDLADFLVQKYDVFGVTIQNWMILAATMVVVILFWTGGSK
jgi:hypothetical protein